MTVALVLFEIWTVTCGAVLAGCLLRLRPLTVAAMTPAFAGLFLFVRAVA